MVRCTDSSLPGMGFALMTTVSASRRLTIRCSPAAMRTSAESGSPCAPVQRIASSLSGMRSCSFGVTNMPGWHVQVAELLGDLDVLEHRPPDDEAAPSACLRGVDRLLQSRDVGRERRHQDPALRRREDGRESLTDGPLARRRPLLLRVGAVAEQQQHALVADARQPCQVGRLALHRRAVDLEVARVHDDAGGRAHHERACVRDGVGRVHPFDVEAAERARVARAHRVQLGRLDEPVLAQLVAQEAEGQRRAVDGHGQARQHVRQRADVVLVPVGQDDAADVRDALLEPRDVRDHQVDAEHLLLREHQAGVDHHDVVAAAEREHVAADLAESPERDQRELRRARRVDQKRSICAPPEAAATSRSSDAEAPPARRALAASASAR